MISQPTKSVLQRWHHLHTFPGSVQKRGVNVVLLLGGVGGLLVSFHGNYWARTHSYCCGDINLCNEKETCYTDALCTYNTSFLRQAASIFTSLFPLTILVQKSVSKKWKKPGSIPHVIGIRWTQVGPGGWDRTQLLIYIDIHASVILESEFFKLAGLQSWLASEHWNLVKQMMRSVHPLKLGPTLSTGQFHHSSAMTHCLIVDT